MPSFIARCVALCLSLNLASGISLTVSSEESIASAASQVAYGMMKYYTGNETGGNIGNLPSPYYWWEAGAMFGTIIEYWYYTGDTTYNNETITAMTFQAGSSGDFMPANQTKTEGNDDQVFWAFAAMTAAELGFPAPPDSDPSWLSMAQAVFNEQAARWDTTTCAGGLRWQIFTWNNGYTYKNLAANGGFFQLASRLYRYTGNSTYQDWADKTLDWLTDSVLYQASSHQIYDGTSDTANCTAADHTAWSYNYGFVIGGLAYMYNTTEDEKYLTTLTGVLNTTIDFFFPTNMGDKIMVEVACEPLGNCDNDNYTFKGITARWLAVITQLVPSLASTIWPYLQASAVGAAGQCDGGTDGMTCGFRWNTTTWDGLYGVGQQMSALSVIGANMMNVKDLKGPLTATTGGTSKSNPSAGTDTTTDTDEPDIVTRTITGGDKAGAAILTILVVVTLLGGATWMVLFE